MFIKDPDAILDYGFDWSEWLDTGETIIASTWTVPTGVTEVSSSNTTTACVIWLSGGTVDAEYELVNHITTSATREEDRTLTIKIKER